MSDLGDGPYSGGCQCGAVRFSIESFGRSSICHCRMCQKAFGGIGGVLVTALGLMWTRGAPKIFRSSNRVQRGFCDACGTPLTFATADGVDIAVCALDDPSVAPPSVQLAPESRVPWADSLPDLPERPESEASKAAAYYASIISHQHPDCDTDRWPPEGRVP
jgi:hypothetical protein